VTRGILAAAGYVPHGRLERTEIAAFAGTGGGKGTRSVAWYDEDTTTLGVEAARIARRARPDASPSALYFSTITPAYVDKTNATGVAAALRLDSDVLAVDFGGAQRSAVGAVLAALRGTGTVLTVAADARGGLAGSGDEAAGGDGASALLIGDDSGGPLLAEFLGSASVSEEFTDRWRTPGDVRSKLWEERFGETVYAPLGERAWREALKQAELDAGDVDRVIVTGLHARAVRVLTSKIGVKDQLVDDLSSTVGNTGSAHPGLLLAAALEEAQPGQVIALVVLADGADVLVFRAGEAAASAPVRPVAAQVAGGTKVPYGKFLSWRGGLVVEPPRRPEPSRMSASAAARNEDWKYAFAGRRDPESGAPQLPPLPTGGDLMPMSDVPATIATFTIDRLAYSPSPPILFAVLDFDGGGRYPAEITDVTEADIAHDVVVGGRVEMTFRRLFTADGLHNYFWKARPLRGVASTD
jgi:3-hydroxy-3-methylglutaryl CoA synthase